MCQVERKWGESDGKREEFYQLHGVASRNGSLAERISATALAQRTHTRYNMLNYSNVF